MATVATTRTSVTFIEWGAVFAGTVLACAVTLVLAQFGASVGLSIEQLSPENANLPVQFFTVGIWTLWIQLMAAMSGAYMAGRMRNGWEGAASSEGEIRDGAHGLLVWALSTLVIAAVAAFAGFFATIAASHGAPIDPSPEIPQEFARKAGIVTGFSLTASSIVSALAAWWMGTVGGDHRDNAGDLSHYISFRKKAVAKK